MSQFWLYCVDLEELYNIWQVNLHASALEMAILFRQARSDVATYGHGVRAKTEESNLYKHNKKITMNKAGIIEAVHAVLGGTKVQAEQVVETVLNTIVESLKKGEEVSIAGLGIFSVKMRAAREARNPRTGEAIKVAAMKVPKFRAAKALKDAVK
jgi:DNA-binding protein HU-beta